MNAWPRTWTALLLIMAGSAAADEIGYLEDFSLATDRAEALKLLIPGSEDYYYFACLHYQNTQQFGRVEKLLEAWVNRYKDTPRIREIQNRQALLTYPAAADESLEFLRRRLNIHFQHQAERQGRETKLPSALDDRLISRQTLDRRARQQHTNLAGFEDSALEWLITGELTPDQRRHLLERLRRPDHPGLARLVADELKTRGSKPFGKIAIHRLLLLDQLTELLRLRPDLRNQRDFVNVYLTKLQPSDDEDWQHDAASREAYLDRLWEFAGQLRPAHNSLKAHVLYHRLVHDRAQGLYDKERFMTYIRLPRKVAYIEPSFIQRPDSRQYTADLNAAFDKVTLFGRVRDDEPLVRSFLHHFFIDETSTKPYEPFLRDDYLRERLAETKIVNGLGEPEQWYSVLAPEKYQVLKDRVDLDFAFTNRQQFAAEQPVRLDLFVKNVRTLIVKVFEINTKNYYREYHREVNTDINLDGLVANQEQTYQYDEPPLRRVKRRFEFASLNGPGVYVIDFIGNGVSSRAVVRKGKLRYLARMSTAGHLFTVYDQRHRPIPGATIWMDGHEYEPDEKGRIVIPYTAEPGSQSLILSHGDFSSLERFPHAAENYRLEAGFYVDREALLQRRTAQLVVRPSLRLNGTPVTLSVLEDVRLTVTSTDHDGVATTREVNDFELFEDRESVFEFQTPPRLAQIQFGLHAKVQSLSRNKKIDLNVGQTFALNAIDKTERVEDLHFEKMGEEYVLEVRGKSGEAKPARPVRFSFKHRDFRQAVELTLQTDDGGRVRLGKLANIVSLTATGAGGSAHTWHLLRDEHTYHQTLHGVAGETVELPYMGPQSKPSREALSLLELRGGTFARDRFDALSIQDEMLRMRKLPPGDYDLLLKESGHRIRVRLVAGPQRNDYVLGRRRYLELRAQRLLQLAPIEVQDETITIRLRNASPFARVHVFATRYQPAYGVFGYLGRIVDPEPIGWLPLSATTSYVAGRNIGDEYRYIIDRKYARRFPGNMLERPSLLLNPWALRSTESERRDAAEGDEFAAEAEAQQSAPARPASPREKAAATGDFANLDFLAEASTVALNLRPDPQGVVTVSRKDLGAHQQLHVVAVDPRSTAYRTLALPEQKAAYLDLRMAKNLDPQQHFIQQKQISQLPEGGTFKLADVTTSKFEAYDSLARVHALYATLSKDPSLTEFAFLLNWLQTPAEKKRSFFSKYACHELSFFIYHKDREFFEKVVAPYLKNKRDKTFLDLWLIGLPVDRFLSPRRYSRLNVVERILLSQRVAADRKLAKQHVKELYELLPPNIDRFNFLFLTAVQGRALDTSDALGLGAVRRGEMLGQKLELGGAVGDFAAARAPAAKPPVEEMALGLEEMADLEAEAPAAGRSRGRKKVAEGKEMALRRATTAARGKARAYFDTDKGLRGLARRFYQKLDKTQEWAENNYYQLPIEQQNAALVTVNAFWRDYANHDPQQPFTSVHLAEASRNFTEMMLALAVLDLPLQAKEHESQIEAVQMTLKAANAMVVFHEEILPAEISEEETTILISQNFFRHDDRYRYEEGQRRDKFVTEEFLVHTVYGCQIVVTNPSSAPQKLDVLLQIPQGALPVMNSQATRSVHLDLPPYHTQTMEYHFYFPASGRFSHYPVHVARNQRLLAYAAPMSFNVVGEPSRIDRSSWEFISQHGSDDDVLEFLEEQNLQRTDLDKIAFRMRDKPFFRAVVQLLTKRHAYNHTLWSYGIHHGVVPAVREYLQHCDEFVSQCGTYLDSPLLSIDPVARKAYQHLDYRPLVNARAHPLGRRRTILNDRLYAQYHQLLAILSCKRDLDSHDLMSVVYYQLLQDRVADSLTLFDRVDAGQLETRLQYDYFAAYLAMYREDLAAARRIADRYRNHPVDRWRDTFAAVGQQLDEIEGAAVAVLDEENRDQQQTRLAATEPGFEFKVEARQVAVNFQNIQQVRINYYLMDIELLFSRNPFVQQYSNQFSHIRPNRSDTVELPADRKSLEFPLPAELHNRNVLVEMSAAGQTKTQAYYSNSLVMQTIENYGQLRVASRTTGRPLGKVYVKVYASMNDGQVRFYKDGYTDLRGRFDYASLNTNELDHVRKFALLVLSDQDGAAIQEANPPKR